MIGPVELVLAFILDLATGDPVWMPHPVRLIGRLIGKAESFLREHFKGPGEERWAGVFLVLIVPVPVFFITLFLCRLAVMSAYSAALITGTLLMIWLTSTTIAVRELVRSGRLVIESVRDGDLETARKKLSMIVGRDTHSLSEREVLKAAMETLAENLSDGVIAPVFYLVIGGLPLAMAYKAINTLDSMVGYRNEKYLYFGWASARLDDLANFIPARITGLLIALSAAAVCSPASAKASLRTMLRDGGKHPSPNSGVPEAAMAGALGVRMGGPSTYGGILVEKPYIGEDRADENEIGSFYLRASGDAVNIVKATSLLGAGIAVFFLFLRSLP